MHSDIEDRLHSVWDAAAVLTESPAGNHAASTTQAVRSTRPHHRKVTLLPVFAAVLAGLLAFGGYEFSTSVGSGRNTGMPEHPGAASSVGGASLVQPSVPSSSNSGSPSATLPVGAVPRIGASYSFDLLIHCGVKYAVFGDQTWQAVPPIPRLVGPLPDSHGMTTSTGFVRGVIVELSPNVLRFTVRDPAYRAATIRFIPTNANPPLCA